MTITEMNNKRSALLASAGELTKSESITPEQRSQFDAILADVTELDGDINRVTAIEEARAKAIVKECSNRPNPSESNDPEERSEVRNSQVKASFREYLKTGTVEARDLTSANSGVVIPQLFDPQVIEAQKSYGQLLDMVNLVQTDTGNPMRIVLDNDTANGLTLVTSGVDAAELDPALTSITLSVDNYSTGVVKVDMGVLNDAGFDVDAFVRDKFAKRYFRGASNLIYSGNAANIQALSTSYSAGFVSGTLNKLTYPDFATAIATLDPAYQANACWAVSNSTLGYIVGMTDTANRPLFLPYSDGGTSGFVGTILGKPVKLVTQLPAVATGNGAVMFGDFKQGYTFRAQNPGLSILRLNERYAAGFEVGFVAFARIGGAATNAGVPPVLTITIK